MAIVKASLLRKEVLLIWAGLTPILVIAGPFGTYDKSILIQSALFWGLVIGLSILFVTMLRVLAAQIVPGRSEARRVAFVTGGMFLLMTPIVIALDASIFGVRPEVPRIVMSVALVSAALGALRLFLHRTGAIPATVMILSEEASVPAPVPPPPVAAPRLLARLACGDAHILALSARSHYVTVRTNHGPETVLLRFSDALEELEGLDGLRIHRSHWVARAAVRHADMGPQKATVRLTDGTVLPVSRTYRDSVEAAGFPPAP
ncbi:LytTR family DNA-binding domain-containing protein [Anianabacter salinae]|uniref:LytTR family DNA-binding domain-containing protein n=1 Tax=Anianabacter salinae TaxID=2851023 RepID=UPI00225E48DC|nr:LytTR family DNA-binding domain-containing protein [Anianabacter salinae]MBV0911724.1 LytTR family transcriptional regulator [Anianabacter salinae]